MENKTLNLRRPDFEDMHPNAKLFTFDEEKLVYVGYDNESINALWSTWCACIGMIALEVNVVPEGFVLVPKLLSDELADELASDFFNNIQTMFDYEHRGSTATHREQIRLSCCKNKAREFQENYKIVIKHLEWEPSHDS